VRGVLLPVLAAPAAAAGALVRGGPPPVVHVALAVRAVVPGAPIRGRRPPRSRFVPSGTAPALALAVVVKPSTAAGAHARVLHGSLRCGGGLVVQGFVVQGSRAEPYKLMQLGQQWSREWGQLGPNVHPGRGHGARVVEVEGQGLRRRGRGELSGEGGEGGEGGICWVMFRG
jgi:hypothetical protein